MTQSPQLSSSACAGTNIPCLLCTGTTRTHANRWTGRQIRTLYNSIGISIQPDDCAPIDDETVIEMLECTHCGFRFFDPEFAGGARFYAALGRNAYYPEDRPEFQYALRELARHGTRRVLDVGGGAGAFLDLALRKGLQSFGVELNPEAVEEAAAKGHRMLAGRIEELNVDHFGGALDAITAFHVLEHVPNPLDFLQHLRRLLRPGGTLIVAVPNDRGVRRVVPDDPANLPPHHISRWRRCDLRAAAHASGFHFAAASGDPLYGRSFCGYWLLQNRFSATLGKKCYPGGEAFPKALSFVYRKLGLRHLLPRWGMSLFAILRNP